MVGGSQWDQGESLQEVLGFRGGIYLISDASIVPSARSQDFSWFILKGVKALHVNQN